MVHRLVAGCLTVLGVACAVGFAAGQAYAMGSAPSFSFQAPGGFANASGAAVDQSNGDVYISDLGGRVWKFKVNLAGKTAEPELAFGHEGYLEAPGTPFELAVDNYPGVNKGDLFVPEIGGNVVTEYSSAGAKLPSSIEGLTEPTGVGFDVNGNIYVSELPGSVVKFNAEGKPVNAEGKVTSATENTLAKANSQVRAMAVSSNGEHIYLASEGGVIEYTLSGGQYVQGLTLDSGAVTDGVAIAPAGSPAVGDVFVESNGNITVYAPESLSILGAFGPGVIGGGGAVARLAVYGTATGTVVYAPNEGEGVEVFETFKAPTATTGASSNVTQAGATVEGTVENPEELTLSACFFEYEVNGTKKQVACEGGLPSGNAPVTVSAKVTGLEPGSKYQYTLIVEFEGHTAHGAAQVLSTTAGEPLVVSESASHIERHTALLLGEVNPENKENEAEEGTTYYFEYGETEHYGQVTSSTKIPAPGGLAPVKAGPEALIELKPNTVYHYRLVAKRGSVTTEGPPETFKTKEPTPPEVPFESSSQVTQTSAFLAAVVNPNGLPTSYALEVGTEVEENGMRRIAYTPTYGSVQEGEPLFFSLTGLQPATTYHYRIVATNEDGTKEGPDQTFTTPGFAPVILAPASLPLVPTPTEEKPVVHKVETRAEKYTKAVSICEKDKSKKKRAACLKTARQKYGPVTKKKKK
jgi:hypothetical protein